MIALSGRRAPVLLELDLTEPPADPDLDDPIDRLRNRGRRLLRPTLRALHEAGSDDRVTGLVAKVGGRLPWPMMQELRAGIAAFAATGKPTTAWAESFGEGAQNLSGYVLATAFDQIWLLPGGEVGALGVGVETTFLRGALDKIGIEPQFEQRREFKNAPDQLLRTEYSAAHREALTRLTESIFDDAVDAVADGRGLSGARIRELIETGPMTAAEAVAAGLVDRLGYRDEVYRVARGGSTEDAGTELLFADRWAPRRRLHRPDHRRPHLALVEIRGGIVGGRSRRGLGGRQTGSDTVASQLRAVLEDDRAHGLLLQVDSPGGSAIASEVIWREVCRVREAGKPVVVSMGSVAASGGYYVACPADVILALPSTLTGSIGVFGGKLVLTGLLDRIGVTTGQIEHGAQSLMFSSRKGFSEDQRERLAHVIDAVYTDFVAKVAAGRGRDVEAIDAVAGGRVWTGRDALAAGLVDELGGLRDAVRIARSKAGLAHDAPVTRSVHIPPLARLSKPKNSEDPRTVATSLWSGSDLRGVTEIAALLGLPAQSELRMPPFELR